MEAGRLGFPRGTTPLALGVWGAAALVYLALLVRPLHLLMTRPFLGEAFYTLAAARSLALGQGSAAAADPGAGVAPTLLTLFYAPAFALAPDNPAAALRLCLLGQVVLFALASLLIGLSLGRAERGASPSTPGWGAALVFCNYTLASAFLAGLATALVVTLVFAAFAWHSRPPERGARRAVGRALVTGVLCGCAGLARGDAALFAVALAGWHALAPAEGSAGVARPRLARGLESALLLSAAAAVWAAWAWATHTLPGASAAAPPPITFQDVRPMSTWIATLRTLSNQCFGIVHLATRHDHLGGSNIAGLLLLLAVTLVTLAVPALRARARRAYEAWRARWDLGALAPLWLYALLLLLAYTLFYRVPHLQAHYLLIPRLLLLFLLVSFGLAFLQTFARRGTLLLAALAAWSVVSLGLRVRDFSGASGNVMMGPARWMAAHLQPGERVGLFQSGTAGFLDPERVVNLDGNRDREALAAVRARQLSGVLATRHVRYLIDRREYLALAWRDTALVRRAVRVARLDNELEVWELRPE